MSSADELQQELMRVRRNAIELHSSDQVQEAIAKLAFEVTEACSGTVSYTHLTLPTIYSV